MKEYYSIGEAAEILGVSKETLRRWDKAGKYPSERHPMNNYRVYDKEMIENLENVDEIGYNYTLLPRYGLGEIENLNPYFNTNSGILYNADAFDFLRSLDNNSVQLIFADPPYNIKKAHWDTFSSQREYLEWSIEWIIEAKRVLTVDGSLYICGFSEILADIKWATSNMFDSCKWLIWFYRNKANLGNDWGRSHESILHLRKSKKRIFNIDAVRVPYNEHTLKYPERSQADSSQYSNGSKKKNIWKPNPAGAKPKDVFEIPTISNSSWERVNHPTQKPVELVKKFVLGSSSEGDLVVDPFGGSGTTYAVAEAFGRRWMGSELSKDYCEVIKKRVTDKQIMERIKNGLDAKESTKRRKTLRG